MYFYTVNEDYIKFLQELEKSKRGFTKVFNVSYANHNKLVVGVVMSVGRFNYFVSLSSYTKKQESNILIRIKDDKDEVKGSLRFSYMIPAPEKCIKQLDFSSIKDEKYRLLLQKEYEFCTENEERIKNKANKIYNMVITNKKPILTENSCDFLLLEKGYDEYIKSHLNE